MPTATPAALPVESRDAPRATPPTRHEATPAERDRLQIVDAEALDEELENPYDNVACTD